MTASHRAWSRHFFSPDSAPRRVAKHVVTTPRPEWPTAAPRRVRRRADLERVAGERGFELLACHSDEDDSSGAFDIDFALMSPDWLECVPESRRVELAALARERLDIPIRVHSTRVVMVRTTA